MFVSTIALLTLCVVARFVTLSWCGIYRAVGLYMLIQVVRTVASTRFRPAFERKALKHLSGWGSTADQIAIVLSGSAAPSVTVAVFRCLSAALALRSTTDDNIMATRRRRIAQATLSPVICSCVLALLTRHLVDPCLAPLARQRVPAQDRHDPACALVSTLFSIRLRVVILLTLSSLACVDQSGVISAHVGGIGFGLQEIVRTSFGPDSAHRAPVKVGDLISISGVEGDIRRSMCAPRKSSSATARS